MAGTWRRSRERIEAPLLERRGRPRQLRRPADLRLDLVDELADLGRRRFRLLALDADQRLFVFLIGEPDLERAVGEERDQHDGEHQRDVLEEQIDACLGPRLHGGVARRALHGRRDSLAGALVADGRHSVRSTCIIEPSSRGAWPAASLLATRQTGFSASPVVSAKAAATGASAESKMVYLTARSDHRRNRGSPAFTRPPHVLAFDVSGFTEPLAEAGREVRDVAR